MIFHLQRGEACLVVSNDEEIQEEAQTAGAGWMLAWDFVVGHSPERPVFSGLPTPLRPPRIPAGQTGAPAENSLRTPAVPPLPARLRTWARLALLQGSGEPLYLPELARRRGFRLLNCCVS
jgi:hypothetical protein